MSDEVAVESRVGRGGAIVLRNTLFLLAAQAITTPLSILINAVTGRYLGPAEFGLQYVAYMFCGVGMIVVDWGQGITVPAMVTRDRASAGRFLASAAAWRLLSWLGVCAAMIGVAIVLGYERDLLLTLFLVAALQLVQGIVALCVDTVRGFERTDVQAYVGIGQQFLIAAVLITVLLAGGRLWATLIAQIGIALTVLLVVGRVLRPLGIGNLNPDRATIRHLLVDGFPLLFFAIAMVLQPAVDAAFLSRLAPTEVAGWHAAARRLSGVLVAPAAAIISALYPTLCRLATENPAEFRATTAKATKGALLIAVPAALGCGLYPEVGVSIFGRDAFGPAEDNLRILAPFLVLVYLSMVLGTGVIAAGKKKTWAGVQLLCVVVSLVLDPLLIPWFQERTGNGGLGVCVAALASEVVMVSVAVWLIPGKVFDAAFARQLVPLIVAGGAMAATAVLLSSLNSFISAPIAIAAFVSALWLSGGIEPEHVAKIRGFLGRKLSRR